MKFVKDINKNNYYGHANDKNCYRTEKKKWLKQRKKRGFDDSELWHLDSTINDFIYKRLIRFKKINRGFPMNLTWKKWNKIIDKMIIGFELENKLNAELTEKEKKSIKKAYKLFAKWHQDLFY